MDMVFMIVTYRSGNRYQDLVTTVPEKIVDYWHRYNLNKTAERNKIEVFLDGYFKATFGKVEQFVEWYQQYVSN